MNRQLNYLLAALILAAACMSGLLGQETKPQPAAPLPQAWRHLALEQDATQGIGNPEFARRINQLGNEGWELVDVESVTEEGTTTRRIYFFKKPQ